MRIAEMLMAMAAWLESPENEALLLAEYNPDCMEKVANHCVAAAAILKKCADEVDIMEDKRRLLIGEAKQLLQAFAATPLDGHALTVEIFDGDEKLGEITASSNEVLNKLNGVELLEDMTATVALAEFSKVEGETLEKIAKLANVFDVSSDEGMRKQASVIDELLLSVSAPKNWAENFKAAQSKKLDTLKKLYQEPNEKLHEVIGVEDAKKAIEKSEYNKEYRILEAPLSSRYCPNHAGALLYRISADDNEWACSLDHKHFNFSTGYTTENGNKVPPGGPDAVAENTKLRTNFHQIFDNRQDRLNKMR